MLMMQAFLIAMSLLPSSFAEDMSRILSYEPAPTSCASLLDPRVLSRPAFGTINTSVPLTPENVIQAAGYRVFPYHDLGGRPHWTRLPRRGLLDLNSIRLFSNPDNIFDASTNPILRQDRTILLRIKSRIERDEREGKNPEIVITKSEDFDNVIEACANQQRFTKGIPARNWISRRYLDVYKQLNRMGYAWSRGLYRDGKLVAGFYGLYVDGSISGESMFHDRENGGGNMLKYLLVDLAEETYAYGHRDIDTQIVAGLIAKWGGQTIRDDQFKVRNARLKAMGLDFPDFQPAHISRVAAE